MENSVFKLVAKKRMMKNYCKCFIVSVFPFILFLLLATANYFLLLLLNNVKLNEYFSLYGEYVRFSAMGISITLSLFVYKSLKLCADNYFLLKALNKRITLIKAIKCVSLRQCFTNFMVSVIRFCLSISWFLVYFSPCIAVSLLLIYSYKNGEYGFSINLTLFISAIILFIIGAFFFYITLKRYTMCSFVILTDKEKNPLNVIVKSINFMENHSVKYAVYCLSYSGWLLSCIFIVPIVYVLPYITIGKWCFKYSLTASKITESKPEKPIIFYFNKRVEN